MRIAVGSDHRGFQVKQRIANLLRERSIEVEDHGTHSTESVDYPEVALRVSLRVARAEVDRGILICGTGIGMSLAANKVAGIRATPVHDDVTAELSRSHNDSNILCLSADLLGERLIDHIVAIWLDTEFGGGRHARRLAMVHAIEQNPDGVGAAAGKPSL